MTADGKDYDFDLLTLGAGSGGVRASRFCAQIYGAKVAVVELPFGFVSSDDIGGAGGTWVPASHVQSSLVCGKLSGEPVRHGPSLQLACRIGNAAAAL